MRDRFPHRLDSCARGLGAWLKAHIALVGFCAFVGLYYLWTIRSSRDIGHVSGGPGYYNMLADALLHGHLRLLTEPSQQLLALPDPYNPAQNAPFRLHDLSLYHGHYYLYWGPGPAVVLFAPLRLLGIEISQSTAIFIFAFTGFCFSVAVLRELVARLAADAPRWMVGAGCIALAFGNALPFTLRRSEVYEVAIAAAFCFCFIALYLAITALRDDGVSRRRLAGAGIFIGLAVASRPTMLIVALALVCLAIWLARRSDDKTQGRRILVAAIAPLAVIGVLLGAYNAARFGSPFEFGQSYQLAFVEVSTKTPNQPSYVPPGIWYYLFAPPDFTWRFPYIQLAPLGGSYPLPTPRAYTGLEHVSGLLISVPFTLFAFAGLVVTRARTRLTVAVLTAMAMAILLITSAALWGATQRYEVDFASLLLIAAALTWLVWSGSVGPRARRIMVWGGVVLIAWGVVFGIASGMTGYYDSLRLGSPGTYNRLERYTSIVPTLGSRLEDRPLALNAAVNRGQLSDSDTGNDVGTLRVSLPAGGTADITVASASARRYGLALAGTGVPGAPLVDRVLVRVPQTGYTQMIDGGSFGPAAVPVKLRRGLNHVLISADGPAGSEIRLTGVRLTPHSNRL